MRRGKGVVLVSGGLDSMLAARLLIEQGIEIVGFHCVLPFVAPDADPANLAPVRMASQIHMETRTHRCGSEYLDMLRHPTHGYGKHINPCIDCHIYFITKAADFMIETGADFVATGEVVGQRPMSQMKHMLNHIEKAAGLRGRILRPLSAQLLAPTIPETEGIVDRSRLLGISGRSRKKQFALADQYGIDEYASPSGGCLFTDRYIAARVKDLIERQPLFEAIDIYLCTLGRHFRISDQAKIIVGRNERENAELEKYRAFSDGLMVPAFKGPVIYIKGEPNEWELEFSAAVLAYYAKKKPGARRAVIYRDTMPRREIDISEPVPVSVLEKMRI